MTADDAIRAYLLADSDRRDAELAAQLAAWRDGYQAAAAEFPAHYERGYTDAQTDAKAISRGVVLNLQQHIITWDGLRENFHSPRPGDYPGRESVR